MIEIHPDFSIPFSDTGLKLSDFREKVEAACRTAELLGLSSEFDENDVAEAEGAIYAAVDPDASKHKEALRASEMFKPATYHAVKGLLNEYSVRVVDNATQIRLLVTNKLLLEAENPDPRIRMKALELLGKITDVGLFTEKSEVTVTHRSTDELVNSIRAKIDKMREPKDITSASQALVNGRVIDIEAELND